MNKTAIKNFAIWARNKLIADISYRAGLMGITADGIQNALPQSTGTTEFYDIGTSEPYTIVGDAVKQRRHLVELIRAKERETNYKTAYKYVLEEVAYTWFNRLIAVRFMEVNDYLPSHIRVLSSESGKMEPDLVTTPFDAELSFTRDEEKLVYQMKQENKIDELFRILFIKQCNALNENLPALFEKTSDYTELLLNLSVIDQDGVVYHLVHDISEEDFNVERGGQIEIIGWLYQYYISEKHEEVIKAVGKVTVSKEDVPAATQLFTPEWIVKYMVENSLGRIWLEGHHDTELKEKWIYYLDESQQDSATEYKLQGVRKEYANISPKDIKVFDPCMGSGHILVYAFDVLMQIYESVGYGQRDAAKSILENNLYGLDIDDRAFQMAYFAVMMKARQYNRRILNGEYRPHVYSIQESNGINRDQLKYFGAGLSEFEKNNAITQMNGLLNTFRDAKEYGSILTVDRYDWDLLERFVSNTEVIGQLSMYTAGLDDTAEQLKNLIAQAKVIADKYHTVITNPPYLNRMSGSLKAYVNEKYKDYSGDLFSVFIVRDFEYCLPNGFSAMMSPNVWLFIKTYERLREFIVGNKAIASLVQLAKGSFFREAAVDIITFVLRNTNLMAYRGSYIRLEDFKPDMAVQNQKLIDAANNMAQHYVYSPSMGSFRNIQSTPIAFWCTEKLYRHFMEAPQLVSISAPRQGLATADNNRFLRLWYEVEVSRIGFEEESCESAAVSGYKWFPYNKGGAFRRWYGNKDYVVNWLNDGFEIKNFRDDKGKVRSRPQNLQFYFRPSITWSDITSGSFSGRYSERGSIFDVQGSSAFPDTMNIFYLLGFMNSSVSQEILKMLNPTLHTQVGDLSRLPVVIDVKYKDEIDDLVKDCIHIAKDDWNSNETSWQFIPPYTNNGFKKLSDEFDHLSKAQVGRFNQLYTDENKINALFTQIYGLEDELDASVSKDNITVKLPDIVRDVKSFLSYFVGCLFGRYSLDKTGLIYAGGIWDEKEYITFIPDQDNIIPLTDEEYLEDDIISRLCTWLKVVYGEHSLEENLDFISNALGNSGKSSREIIRNYFLNDFFKDHCQTYSVTGSGKRPIYWLFDSGKQNGFKALIYLHRYNADTIGNLRIDYLHRMQRIYESEINRMQDMIDHSTSAREAAQATKRREKLTKQLKECREYDEKLAHLALSRIELDLDDGVKVNYRKLQTASDGKFYEVLADSKNIMSKK